MQTRFTQLVGCKVPIQLAAMPAIGSPALVRAGAAGGAGLGRVGVPTRPAEVVTALLADLRSRTTGAVGVNFLMPFLDRDVVAVAAGAARVVEFFYGEPERALVDTVHRGGALASWQ